MHDICHIYPYTTFTNTRLKQTMNHTLYIDQYISIHYFTIHESKHAQMPFSRACLFKDSASKYQTSTRLSIL